MMIPDGYNVNISKDGKFYGRLEMTDVVFSEQATERFLELRDIFPKEFKLTLQHVTCRGNNLAEA